MKIITEPNFIYNSGTFIAIIAPKKTPKETITAKPTVASIPTL